MDSDALRLVEIPPCGEESTGYEAELVVDINSSGTFCFHCSDRSSHREDLNQSIVYLTRDDIVRLIGWLQERV